MIAILSQVQHVLPNGHVVVTTPCQTISFITKFGKYDKSNLNLQR